MQHISSGLLGFWISTIVRRSKEHSVQETGSISILKWGGGSLTLEEANLSHLWLRLALSKERNFSEEDPVFETLFSLEY
jgi:hypothetical protein